MSVFVSRRGSDRAVRDDLVAYLQQALGPDEVVWDADRYCASNPYKEFIEAIHECEVFVLIVSDETMKPSYVLNEMIEARQCEMAGTLNMVLYKVTDSPLTPDFAAQINHLTDTNFLFRMMGEDNGLAALAARVRDLLAKRRAGKPENPYNHFCPRIKGAAVSGGYFVPHSRDREFAELDAAFARSQVVFTTQISGYGRKSLAREYALTRASEYTDTVMLHYFSGSLREFFTKGLWFTNVNDMVFDDMEENELILCKAGLLERLGPDTLLIVPEITPDARDDRFVYDALARVGCRIIFVSQQVPRQVRDAFPVLSVDRMQDRYLKELFFNYYTADEEEQAALDGVLSDFFDSIDGHTKSVEITATELADEFGIYPEDIPDIIENICSEGGNALSERIYRLISELFDVSSFSPVQQAILQAAAFFADRPMEEKEFVELLRAADCYDAGAMRALIERRWLDHDREHRTLSVDAFLAQVCMQKIPEDVERSGAWMDVLYQRLMMSAACQEMGLLHHRLHSLERYCLKTGRGALAQLAVLMIRALDAEDVSNVTGTVAVCAAAREQACAAEEPLCSVLCNICDLLESTVRAGVSLADAQASDADEDLDERIMRLGMGDDARTNLEDVVEQITDPRVRQVLERFCAAAFGRGDRITAYENALYVLSQMPEDEMDPTLLIILGQITVNLQAATHSRTHLCLRINRAWMELTQAVGFPSLSGAYIFLYRYARLLHEAELYTEEFDRVIGMAVQVLEDVEDDVFKNAAEREESLADLLGMRGLGLIHVGDLEQAREACRVLWESPRPTARYHAIYVTDRLTTAYVAAGELEEALSVLRELPDVLPQDEPEQAAMLEAMLQLRRSLESPVVAEPFTDEADNYVDYYRAYATNRVDRRAMARYSAVADAAVKLDYSTLTEQDVTALIDRLRAQAKQGVPWERLAPQAFALVSEMGMRLLGYRHHYVQYVGAAALMDGKIAEIQNGEGKTYTIPLAAFLHVLYGRQVTVLDSSLYLAQRNYRWMSPLLESLGCTVDLVTGAQDHRRGAAPDVRYANLRGSVYATQNRDTRWHEYDHRERVVLVDEAEQLMIAEGASFASLVDNEMVADLRPMADRLWSILGTLTPADEGRYYTCLNNRVRCEAALYDLIEQRMPGWQDTLDIGQAALLDSVLLTGLLALFVYERDRDYFVQDGCVLREDTVSGTFGRCSEWYEFFLCKREGITPPTDTFKRNRLLDVYTVREYMDTFAYRAGTTATASGMRQEFADIYGMEVFPVPTNTPVQRINHPPAVFVSGKRRYEYIAAMTAEEHAVGRPVLLITESVSASEEMGAALTAAGVPHVVLNARNADEEAAVLEKAGRFGAVTVATALANRGVDIRLGGDPESMARRALTTADTDRQKLRELAAVFRHQTEQERADINELGGLCVIGTACFDDMRLEQQMRGRCARQGDRGESYVFFALDDPAFKRLMGDKYALAMQVLSSLNMTDGAVQVDFLNKTVEQARRRWQLAQYISVAQQEVMHYRPQGRQALQGLMRRLTADYSLVEETVVETLLADEGRLRTSPLYPYIADDLARARRREYPALIRKGYAAWCAENMPDVNEKQRAELFYVLLSRAWSTYLEQMEREEKHAKVVFDKPKRRHSHLSVYSDSLCRRLIAQEVDRLLQAQVK